MRKHIPDAITCLNLFSGCLGIVFAFKGDLAFAAYAIAAGAVFDFFDGMAARLLNAYSETGKDLDSLADMVSFGVLPSVIIFQLFGRAPQLGNVSVYLSYSAFLIAVFSALRLAKFNSDPRQAEHFIGLPTPANALLIASLPLILSGDTPFLSDFILNPYFLFIFTAGMAILLISEVPLISLKFKNMRFNDNLVRYILLLVSVLLVTLFKFAAVPLIIFFYFILSLIQFRFIK